MIFAIQSLGCLISVLELVEVLEINKDLTLQKKKEL